MKVVLAIPTIQDRGLAWKKVGASFSKHTDIPLVIEPGYRRGGWCEGLNEVWEKHPDADIFVCGSDDMYPRDSNWLPPILRWLEAGVYPSPAMENHDPERGLWHYHGAHPKRGDTEADIDDGYPADMATFCVLKKEWLPIVFPLPSNFHYFGDNEIALRLKEAGIDCVACPDSVIVHRMDARGRGAGMGSEQVRYDYDRATYKRLHSGP